MALSKLQRHLLRVYRYLGLRVAQAVHAPLELRIDPSLLHWPTILQPEDRTEARDLQAGYLHMPIPVEVLGGEAQFGCKLLQQIASARNLGRDRARGHVEMHVKSLQQDRRVLADTQINPSFLHLGHEARRSFLDLLEDGTHGCLSVFQRKGLGLRLRFRIGFRLIDLNPHLRSDDQDPVRVDVANQQRQKADVDGSGLGLDLHHAWEREAQPRHRNTGKRQQLQRRCGRTALSHRSRWR